MGLVTFADVFRAYVKPSEKGRLVIRKRTVVRKSAKVIERNKEFAEAARAGKLAKAAHEICVTEMPPQCSYEALQLKPGVGYERVKRCKKECFIRALRIAFERAGLVKYRGAIAGLPVGAGVG